MEARKERKNEWIGCNEGVFASLVASFSLHLRLLTLLLVPPSSLDVR